MSVNMAELSNRMKNQAFWAERGVTGSLVALNAAKIWEMKAELIEEIEHDNRYADQDAYALVWSTFTVEDAEEHTNTNNPLEVSGDAVTLAMAHMKMLTA